MGWMKMRSIMRGREEAKLYTACSAIEHSTVNNRISGHELYEGHM